MGTENQIPLESVSKTDPEIKSIVQSLETRFKEGSKTNEENRSILKIVIVDRLSTITSIHDFNSSMISIGTLTGTFQGGPTLYLVSSGGGGWTKYGSFNLVEESLVAMDQSGSTFVERTQLWIAVSEWKDSPWNK